MRDLKDLMASLTSLTETSVRQVRKTAESPPRVSVIDVVGLVTGQSAHNSAITTQRLLESYPEVATDCSHFRFTGRGQRDTPVADARTVTELVMILPGRAAASVRTKAASVLVRYLGGDASMVAEICANRLSQEDMSEDDPARIFGETIESDVIKLKREEVTLAELDLQLCEQRGALKRRRIESIQHSWSALEACGASDDRDRIRASDMIRTVAFGAPSSPVEKEVCIREVIASAGRTREVGLDCRVGKVAKKLLLAEHPGHVFPKKSIYCNGQQIEANMWLESQRSYIQRALASL